MTLAEAKAVARIIGAADGGCSVCVGNLVDLANEQFPAFEFVNGDSVPGEDRRAVDVREK